MTENYLLKLPINKILNKIFKKFNKKIIKSIILLGSAARNELTTHMCENNIRVISDIEICVLLKPFFIAIMNRKKLYFKIDIYNIEITSTHEFFIKILKTPLVYDLKTTGKLLWGKDIRNKIWINNPKQIPFWEGIRFLYNRLIPFEVLLWKKFNNLPINEKEEYYNTKLLIAIGEFLLIKNRCYFSSYKDKLMYLEKKFGNNNKKMYQILNAFKFKLNYEIEFDNLDSIESTSMMIYGILKRINPYLNSFKIPISTKLFNCFEKIENRDFSNIFSKLKIINIYKISFKILEFYNKSPKKFFKYGDKIELLINEWKNCKEIQSSFI